MLQGLRTIGIMLQGKYEVCKWRSGTRSPGAKIRIVYYVLICLLRLYGIILVTKHRICQLRKEYKLAKRRANGEGSLRQLENGSKLFVEEYSAFKKLSIICYDNHACPS